MSCWLFLHLHEMYLASQLANVVVSNSTRGEFYERFRFTFLCDSIVKGKPGARPNPLAIIKFVISSSRKNLYCCNQVSGC